jgi:hypothetical protein
MPTDSVPGTAYNRCCVCMKLELVLCRNSAVEQGCVRAVCLPRKYDLISIHPL